MKSLQTLKDELYVYTSVSNYTISNRDKTFKILECKYAKYENAEVTDIQTRVFAEDKIITFMDHWRNIYLNRG